MEEGLCVGCGGDCLGIVECSCGRREVTACQDCVDSGMNLVCGGCRDRARRTIPSGSYSCREGGGDGDFGGCLPVAVPVAVQNGAYRAA